MTAAVRVIGCGNDRAADDGAGLEAVRRARPALEAIPGVEVFEAGPGLRVLDLIEGAATVIVVDALRTTGGERPPGSVVRLRLPDQAPVTEVAASSHGFGLRETVGLAAALGRASNVIVLGVEAGDVTAGSPMSPPVEAAVPILVDAIVREAAEAVERTGGAA